MNSFLRLSNDFVRLQANYLGNDWFSASLWSPWKPEVSCVCPKSPWGNVDQVYQAPFLAARNILKVIHQVESCMTKLLSIIKIITPNLNTFFSWDESQSCWNITALVPMTTSSRNIQVTLHIVWRWQVWCLTASTWVASSGRRSTGWRTSRCGAWSWLRGTKLMTSWQNILGKLGQIANINLAYL